MMSLNEKGEKHTQHWMMVESHQERMLLVLFSCHKGRE